MGRNSVITVFALVIGMGVFIGLTGCSDLKNNAVGPPVASSGQPLTFVQDIRPLLQQNCTECHSGTSAKGQYDLSSLGGVLGTGSDATANAIPGDAQSALLTALNSSTHAGVANETVKASLRKWVVEDSMGFKATPVHPEGWTDPASENFHGKSLAKTGYDMTSCKTCHGADFSGGIVQSACTACHTPSPEACNTCHGSGVNAAPPMDLSGHFGAQNPGVGAHQSHLIGTAQFSAVPCEDCHQVPATVDAPGHLDGDGKAEVKFSGLAAKNAGAAWNGETCTNTYCHGAASPKWTAVGTVSCSTCHGAPPPEPHPQVKECNLCHGEVIDADGHLNKALHLDGQVEVKIGHPDGWADPNSSNFHALAIRQTGWSLKSCQACHGQNYTGSEVTSVSCLTCHKKSPEDCSTCHGSDLNPAPPRDIDGHTLTTFRGVGAHQSHVQGGYVKGPVACSECHKVPTHYDDPGHTDSDLPAEVTFGPLATTGGLTPVWDGQKCSNTYCHGNASPKWTSVGVGQDACGSCHGLPPPLPHPQEITPCSTCHGSVVDDQFRIINKDLHINGKVDFNP